MMDIDALDFAKGNGLVTVVCQDAESGAVLMVAHANREALERTIATGEMHYRSRTRGQWRKGETSGHVQRVVELRQDCDADAVLARVEQTGVACHTGSASCFGDLGSSAGILARLDAVIRERATRLGSERSSSSDIKSALGQPPTAGDNIGDRAEWDQLSVVRIENAPGESPVVGDSTAVDRDWHHSATDRMKNAPAESPVVGDNSEGRDERHQPSSADIESQSYTARLLSDRNLRLKKIGEEAAELVTACADGHRERAIDEAADLIYHAMVALRATGAGLRDVERALAKRHHMRSAAPSA